MNLREASIKQIADYLSYLKYIAIKNSNYNEDAGVWKTLYHLVFSDNVSDIIFEKYNFNYNDPDTSYREDVCAFIDAFVEYANDRTDKNGNDLFPSFENWVS